MAVCAEILIRFGNCAIATMAETAILAFMGCMHVQTEIFAIVLASNMAFYAHIYIMDFGKLFWLVQIQVRVMTWCAGEESLKLLPRKGVDMTWHADSCFMPFR